MLGVLGGVAHLFIRSNRKIVIYSEKSPFNSQPSILFQCTLNGVDYRPEIGSKNKKTAKKLAAECALEDIAGSIK